MRIERERDCDSECTGGGRNACKRAGADLFLSVGTICSGSAGRRIGRGDG